MYSIKPINIRQLENDSCGQKIKNMHAAAAATLPQIDASTFYGALSSVTVTPAATRSENRCSITLRNLCSRNANQFVSIFSATDSVLQEDKEGVGGGVGGWGRGDAAVSQVICLSGNPAESLRQSDYCFIIEDVEEADKAPTKRRDTETPAERRYPAPSLRTRAPVSAARAEDIWVMT